MAWTPLRKSGNSPSLAATKTTLEPEYKDPFDVPKVDIATRRGIITRPAVPMMIFPNGYTIIRDAGLHNDEEGWSIFGGINSLSLVCEVNTSTICNQQWTC